MNVLFCRLLKGEMKQLDPLPDSTTHVSVQIYFSVRVLFLIPKMQVSTDIPKMEDSPTMNQLILLELPGNQESEYLRILQEIGTNYLNFGTRLLNDKRGSRVKSFEHECGKNCSLINWHILQVWVSGEGRKPITWKTLVTVLKEVQLEELARKIKSCLNETNESATLGILRSTAGSVITHSVSIKSLIIVVLGVLLAIVVALLVTK